jgi:F420-dependent oxidoreductase-like protein
MRIGLQLPSFSFPGGAAELRPRLTEIAQAAEAAGFDSLWVMDHLFQLPEDTGWGGAEEPMLEAYSTIGFLAGVTHRLRLGALVSSVMYREPGLLLKTATTVDVLSGGRTYLGLGSGWYAREARGLGLPFPTRRERIERLEEVLRIATQAWADDRAPFAGRHYALAEPILRPLPVSAPRPPIMVGGNGMRRTLRLVAQHADACNFLVLEPEEVRACLDALRRHCADVGRDYAEIERTTLDEIDLRPGRMTSADVVSRARAQAEAGIQHWIVNMPDVWDLRYLERVGRDVVPAVAALEAAV